jgi:glycosyltransferase involved in cell wall biosynthesis
MSTKNKFSIVIPTYYNELNIPHTIPRLQLLGDLLSEFELEFIFVDDGSKDRTVPLLLEAQKKDTRIKVIKLSKNFGSISAINAGLHYVSGDCVGLIAADLQDPPELFVEMLARWRDGKKVVMATRSDREEPLSQKIISNSYYYLMDKFAIKGYPKGGFDFVLMDRQVANEIIQISEKNTNIMSLIFWLGHEQEFIPYVRKKREHGKSMWTFSKKIKLFIDSFVSFSYFPIRFMSIFGAIMAVASFIYGVFVIVNTLMGGPIVVGWASLVALMSFFFGLIMIMLGIIGEYLWRILDETRNRPAFIVDEVYE